MRGPGVFAVLLFLVVGVTLALRKPAKIRPQPARDKLDDTVFHWSQRDPVSVRDVLRSVSVMGATGSSKTAGAGAFLMRSLLAYTRSGGIIHGAKPEDLERFRDMFAKAGRAADLLVFSPRSGACCNYLDFISRELGGDAREVTKFLVVVKEGMRGGDNSGGGEMGNFWELAQEEQLNHSVVAIRLAEKKVRVKSLRDFISGAALNPAQLDDPKWRDGYHNNVLRTAHANCKNRIDAMDLDAATQFWTRRYPNLAEKTRSCIDFGCLNLLSNYDLGIVRRMISEESNFSPLDTLKGRWIYCDMAPAEHGPSGGIVNMGLKYLAQRMILRRSFTPGEFIHVIFADEAQEFVNSFDSQYLAQCRSHGGCMIYMSQSLPSYYGAASLKGESGKHQAQALLSNFGTKIFHALGDVESARWAAELVGRERKIMYGGSTQPAELFDELMGLTRFSGSFSEQMQYIIEPQQFLKGRTGGPMNDFKADAIVVKSAEPFSHGTNVLFTTFSQR